MSDEKSVPWQNKTIMLLAVVAAVVAVVLNYIYVSGVESKSEAQQVPVWRAKEVIQPGRRLAPEDLEEGRIPAPKPEDARPFVLAGADNQVASIKGLPVRRRVERGEPIRWDMFTDFGGERTAEDAIPLNWRAFRIEVDPRAATPLVRPGSKIDLHGMLQLPGSDGKPLAPEVEPIIQEVEVLAVGPIWRPEDFRSGRTAGSYTSLTILIPEKLVAPLASVTKLIPPPVMVLRAPSDSVRATSGSQWELKSLADVEAFKRKAQTQKIPFDRGFGFGNTDRL